MTSLKKMMAKKPGQDDDQDVAYTGGRGADQFTITAGYGMTGVVTIAADEDDNGTTAAGEGDTCRARNGDAVCFSVYEPVCGCDDCERERKCVWLLLIKSYLM